MKKKTIARLSALAAGVVVASTATLLGGGAANAATIGTLTVNPATNSTGDVFATLTTSSTCPAGATNTIVRLFGTGLPAGGENLLGNTNLGATTPSGSGFAVAQGVTFKDAFQANAVTAPSGQYTIKAFCQNASGSVQFGEYVGLINFTPTVAFDGSYTTSVPATPTTTTVAPAGPVAFGSPVILTANISPAAAGTVQFKDNGVDLGTPQTVAAGAATFSTSSLSAGTHPITAVFVSTDSNFTGSSDLTAEPVVVNAASTSVAITGNGTSAQFSSVTFTATVTPAAASGSVQFKVDGANAGSPVAVSGGTATFSSSGLAVGSRTIDATFIPANGNYVTSNAPSVTHSVTAYAGAVTTEQINAQVDAGALTISVEAGQDGIVNLHAPAASGILPGNPQYPFAQINAGGDLLQAEGDLDTVVITDTRAGDPGWAATGVVSDFTNPTGLNGATSVSAFNLGWAPAIVIAAANQVGIAAGGVVNPDSRPAVGAAGNPAFGLGTARAFATTTDNNGNGTAKVGAALKLNLPTDVAAGTFGATLTFTVI